MEQFRILVNIRRSEQVYSLSMDSMGFMLSDMPEREKRLSVRIDADERQMLEVLAARDGLTVSDVVRLFARRAYAETIATKPTGTRRI